MKTFLEEISEQIHLKEGEHLNECCLVFPGRRAALFFTKYLSVHLEKPTWAPTFLTISDLLILFTGYRLSDPFRLVFMLYQIYKSVVKEQTSFDDFYSFGEVLINDFNDINKNLVDAESLFKNMASLKSLDENYDYLTEEQVALIRTFWEHFNTEEKSEEKEKFLGIWEKLWPLYSQLTEELEVSKSVYEGMMYRKVSEMIDIGELPDTSYRKIYFIGFNALTKSEKRVLNYLKKSGIAEFFWDYDVSYVSDRENEAGFFLRENLLKFPEPENRPEPDFLLKEEKDIEIISAPTDPGQVKLMSHLLTEIKSQGWYKENNTAVVLADEHLLSQVMHSIPEEFEDINITMGYPVKNTPVFSLVESLLELQNNCRVRDEQPLFYYKDVLRVTEHQYIKFLHLDELEKIKNSILSENHIYINFASYRDEKLVQLIFKMVNGPIEISDYLKEIIYELYIGSSTDDGEAGFMDLQKEYLYYVYLAVNRFRDMLASWEPEMQVSTYLKIFRKLVRSLSIPFTGEPLKGLQVMGVLETRALDFENIIILSMNEGVFPSSGIIHSVIPFNLRRGFGLPVFEHQDRIFAYYFYRLFQRAKRIRFVYNTKTEGAKTGEMSRFLYQIKYLMDLPVKERNLSVIVGQQAQRVIMIEKTDKELSKLTKYFLPGENYLSPSALNTYMDCSLKFYFRYVAGLKEPEEVTEEVDPRVFGNLLHLTMHDLYKDLENKNVPMSGFENILKDRKRLTASIDGSIRKGWLKKESKKAIDGKYLIAREVLLKYIMQILKTDMKLAPVIMGDLEKKYLRTIESLPEVGGQPVRIGGMIDRTDQVKGDYRIIDYKTGYVEKKLKSIASLFERGTKGRNNPAFQTLLYCWLFDKTEQNVKPSLYDIKDMAGDDFSPFFSLDKTVLDYQDVKQEFEEHLELLISKIYDKNIPFQQVEEPEICKYCPYSGLCKK